MYIIGLDLETTGLSPSENRLTEIGAVLWETEAKAPVLFFNVLVDPESPISEEIHELTGITQDQINSFSVAEHVGLSMFNKFLEYADVLIAHNMPFDKGFLQASYERCGFRFPDEKKFVDSATDVPYPKKIETRKLKHLASEHGIINPFSHRATTDVLTMLQIISQYDINEIIANSKIPNITIRAMTNFDQKEKAKARGFRWDGDSKVWIKRIKENQLQTETSACLTAGFSVQEWK
jgi:DNA polymerase-3 subunit epsilon